MRIHVRHQTLYHYEHPVPYGLQQLRLTPSSGPGQQVLEWETSVKGGRLELEFDDHHTNRVSLISIDSNSLDIEIWNEGLVETNDIDGVIGHHRGSAPSWFFLRNTPLTKPKRRVRELAEEIRASKGGLGVAEMHRLSSHISEKIRYLPGTTDATSTAENVLKAGSGVCQDHAHVFISAARHLGLPARYVSGYLVMEDQVDQAASHAWAEVWLENLGWVGFDVSNGISPDERYIRIATGLDYREAAPISGIRFGGGTEDLQVSLQVQTQQ